MFSKLMLARSECRAARNVSSRSFGGKVPAGAFTPILFERCCSRSQGITGKSIHKAVNRRKIQDRDRLCSEFSFYVVRVPALGGRGGGERSPFLEERLSPRGRTDRRGSI